MDEKDLKYIIFSSIISADNDSYTEDVKQDIIRRYDKYKYCDFDSVEWGYVLEPLGDDADRYIKLMEDGK